MASLAEMFGSVGLATMEPEVPRTALSFRQFASRVDRRYQWYRHCEVLAEVLQDVADDKLDRVMVFMPPRHGKSLLTSRLFPAYYLLKHPDRFVGLCSYEAQLAQDFSRTARDFYQREGGELRTDSKAVSLWQTLHYGGMWAAGVGGPITGHGFHLGIIDDPLKNDEEAQSETIRAKHKSWYESTFATRGEPTHAVIVIQTRWNEDDLSGYLLEQEKVESEGWHVVNFEAIREKEPIAFPVTCTVEPDWRKPGEALCPERYDAKALESIRKKRGSRVWSTLYQQRPFEAGGQVFKRDWWRTYDKAPEVFDRVIASWDLSFKDTDGSDFVAGQVWGRVGSKFYLLDRIRERLSFSASCVAIASMYAKWKAKGLSGIYVEDKANGPAVIDSLMRQGLPIVPVTPHGGKVSRAYAAQPVVEAGRCYLPELEPWREDFIREHASFPNGVHDDEVDSFTQAMNVIAWGADDPPPGEQPFDKDRHPGYDKHTGKRLERPSVSEQITRAMEREQALKLGNGNGRMTRRNGKTRAVPV